MERALKRGATQAAVSLSRARFVKLRRRQAKVESLQASTSRGLTLSLYLDGRYSANSTSFLERDALDRFCDECLAMTRTLAPDPHRRLADPELYGPTPGVELDLFDPGYDRLSVDERLAMAVLAEDAARAAGERVVSAVAEVSSQASEALQLHSNGFRGTHRTTWFAVSAQVTVREEGDRRPEDYAWAGARHLAALPDPRGIGEEAARRALERIGSTKVESQRMTLLVENRAAARLVSSLLEPLAGGALQQRRSCFEGKLGEAIGGERLTLVDDPLVPRGIGSRTFDGDGLRARRFPLVEQGRLRAYLVDVYYGRKLGMAPTSGSTSNLVLPVGTLDLDALTAGVDRGVLVTGFLGGNANAASGDFSFGVSGFLVEKGKRVRPVNEMNVTDSHTSLWHRLEAVGNDPYPYSAWAIPSLRFDGVQFSGS
ncbi:MAG: TldD/PmbA family protein [Deltaproteobacteria bacterium]|nr:TldD/PmbA family protein [Deltaproteobacteria bacterium]